VDILFGTIPDEALERLHQACRRFAGPEPGRARS
jgi:hypothetical protein